MFAFIYNGQVIAISTLKMLRGAKRIVRASVWTIYFDFMALSAAAVVRAR